MSLKKFILFEFTPRAAMGCLDDIRDSFDVFEEAVTAADQPSTKARAVVDRDTWIVVVSRRAEPPIELLPPVTRTDDTGKWFWKMEYLKKPASRRQTTTAGIWPSGSGSKPREVPHPPYP